MPTALAYRREGRGQKWTTDTQQEEEGEMARTPYRPRTDLFNPLLDELFRSVSGSSQRMGGLLRAPEADVVERENEIRVTIELPGLNADEIQLDLENNVLTISGEKREERQEENETWHLSERRYGAFSRTFVLPRDVDSEGIQARYEEGVLTITVPKSEKTRRRRIEVRDGRGGQGVEAGGE
jgi:HSP20 family protein